MGVKKLIVSAIAFAVVAGAAVALYDLELRERRVVILSTNDIHANISRFARLAEAVERCRDTVDVVLVDAGDRWTGNAYVDLAEGRRPIIDLMDGLGFSVATLGNHEFDKGARFLANAIGYAKFETVCANVISEDGELPALQPAVTVRTADGIRIRFVGVVTNYDNGHPDGSHRVYEDLEFPDPMESAREQARLASGCDLLVLLSHMGDRKDVEFAGGCSDYDLIIGGHTHAVVDTLVNGTVIGQTGCSLMNVGATSVRMKGRRIVELEYRNVSLDAYGEEPAVAARVREITDNPELNVSVGSTGVDLDKVGLADMFTTSLVEATGADIGMYHYGGIRLITLPAGEVSRAMLFTLEPFSSYVYTMEMTPEQMRRMIITKYNDTGNPKEAHRIDIFASVPYTIVTDGSDNALDVEFPTLKEGREYEVAIANYIVEKYDNVEGDDIECRDDVLVLDAIAKYVGEHSPAMFSNVPKQKRRVVR